MNGSLACHDVWCSFSATRPSLAKPWKPQLAEAFRDQIWEIQNADVDVWSGFSDFAERQSGRDDHPNRPFFDLGRRYKWIMHQYIPQLVLSQHFRLLLTHPCELQVNVDIFIPSWGGGLKTSVGCARHILRARPDLSSQACSIHQGLPQFSMGPSNFY